MTEEAREAVIAEALQTEEGRKMFQEALIPSDPVARAKIGRAFWVGWAKGRRELGLPISERMAKLLDG
jgi:hypothetical protein